MYVCIYIYMYRFMPKIATLRDHKGSIKGHLGGPGMPWPYGLFFLEFGVWALGLRVSGLVF